MNRSHTASHAHAAAPVDTGLVATPHAIRFPRGLPGFESCRSFVLMASETDGTLQYLKSVEGPPASFLVIDPRRVMPAYRCELSETDRHQLGAEEERTLLWLAIVTVEPDGTVTANLRAPVVINPVRMIGQQVIPHHCVYPLRHVLVQG
ncbi:MAG: flagellar assembly protein FliW [Acidobacteria bacterium]|nr:flagellar assembly protein FliW [Acidobacteriota bacterium]